MTLKNICELAKGYQSINALSNEQIAYLVFNAILLYFLLRKMMFPNHNQNFQLSKNLH